MIDATMEVLLFARESCSPRTLSERCQCDTHKHDQTCGPDAFPQQDQQASCHHHHHHHQHQHQHQHHHHHHHHHHQHQHQHQHHHHHHHHHRHPHHHHHHHQHQHQHQHHHHHHHHRHSHRFLTTLVRFAPHQSQPSQRTLLRSGGAASERTVR